MGFFDDADRGLGSVSLAEVIRNRPDVAPSGCLPDRDGTGLAADRCDEGERVARVTV